MCNGKFNGKGCYSSQSVNAAVGTLNLKSYFYSSARFFNLSGHEIVMSEKGKKRERVRAGES